MTYEESLQFLEEARVKGRKRGLQNISEILEDLKRPDHSFPSVQIAGTNGKGSVANFLKDILTAEGLRVGFFSSPHLERYNERIRIGSELISDEDFSGALEEVLTQSEVAKRSAPFELLLAMAFAYFRKEKVDIAVLEVGMGGRLDATNSVQNVIQTIITPIGFDHMAFLGNTLPEIASEKAGIMKKGIPCIVAPQDPSVIDVLKEHAKHTEALFIEVEECATNVSSSLKGSSFERKGETYHLQQLGHYQVQNAEVAITSAETLGIKRSAIKEGLKNSLWPGRLEIIQTNPMVILDGTHNVHGAKTLLETFQGMEVIGVFGSLYDKDASSLMKEVAPLFKKVFTTEPYHEKVHAAQELASLFKEEGVEAVAIKDPQKALEEAKKEAKGIVLVFGSFYLIGELRKNMREER
ncbi:bifunctional folylpolyglutamate synthase/dihydrofolate synthase [Guggenheimella bovis]